MTKQQTATFIELRRFEGVSAPKGATAIFKNEQGGLDRIPIRDLSLAGMLICDQLGERRHAVSSAINNIYLNIQVGYPDSGSKYYIFIERGKIVRSFIDDYSQTIGYGIEFYYSTAYFTEQFANLIQVLTSDPHR